MLRLIFQIFYYLGLLLLLWRVPRTHNEPPHLPSAPSTAATTSSSSRKQTFHSVQLRISARNHSFHKRGQRWGDSVMPWSADRRSVAPNYSDTKSKTILFLSHPCCHFQRPWKTFEKDAEIWNILKHSKAFTFEWLIYRVCVNEQFKLIDHGHWKTPQMTWQSSTSVVTYVA